MDEELVEIKIEKKETFADKVKAKARDFKEKHEHLINNVKNVAKIGGGIAIGFAGKTLVDKVKAADLSEPTEDNTDGDIPFDSDDPTEEI
jgi:hypothetical protein